MARALSDILTELDSTYNPQRTRANEVYTKGLEPLSGMESADLSGLEAAKRDSFEQINTGANRRGMFFSGIPLAEQAKYVGENYLPSVANLKGRYAGLRGNLYQTLSQTLGNLDLEQQKYARDIRDREIAQDLERERIAAEERSRAAAAGSGGGGGGFVPGGYTGGFGGEEAPAPNQAPAPQLSLRQQWQKEASAGDWEAQTLLNFVGDDNNFDGYVNNQSEYNILKKYGVTGNYAVRPTTTAYKGTRQSGVMQSPRSGF